MIIQHVLKIVWLHLLVRRNELPKLWGIDEQLVQIDGAVVAEETRCSVHVQLRVAIGAQRLVVGQDCRAIQIAVR